MKQPFKIGDRVRVYDSTNVFTAIFTSMHAKKGMLWVKDENGVMTDWYVQQCRRLKPKKKRTKKEIVAWANISKCGWSVHKTEFDANTDSGFVNRIACVKLTGEYWCDE